MKIRWMGVMSAALALACGGAQTEPVTPPGERPSSPDQRFFGKL